MIEKKTCYNCGNKNCHIFYFSVKQDVAEHHETYEYTEFDCVNHDKWKELKVGEIRTDNTETLKNALGRIKELEKEKCELLGLIQGKDRDGYLAGAEPREKRIAELEKENAELKENFRICEKNADTYFDNLTKAKEIIEELYNIIPASMSDYAKEPMEHARKFMTEE